MVGCEAIGDRALKTGREALAGATLGPTLPNAHPLGLRLGEHPRVARVARDVLLNQLVKAGTPARIVCVALVTCKLYSPGGSVKERRVSSSASLHRREVNPVRDCRTANLAGSAMRLRRACTSTENFAQRNLI